MPITLFFNYDKTELHTFQPFFLKQHFFQVCDYFLENILLQTPNETDPSNAQFPHQKSSVGQSNSHLETFE